MKTNKINTTGEKQNNPFQAKAMNQGNEGSILQAYKKGTAQLQSTEEEEPVQGKFETTQLAAEEEEEPAQLKENKTGLPDTLKSGVENLSGHSLDDVKVHYNSSQPQTLQAHAYAQGTDIHVAPGQEKHLPHEAWHVAQQKQGRVQPTKQLKGTTNINDDQGLEKEADVMGAKAQNLNESEQIAVQLKSTGSNSTIQFALPGSYEESNADGYNPHGKTDTYNDSVKNSERLATSGFAASWRENMIEFWSEKGWVRNVNSPFAGTYREIKDQKHGVWSHENGIQLDHATTVATMRGDLLETDEDTAIDAAYDNPTMKSYYHLEDEDREHITWPTSKKHAEKKNSKAGISVEPTIHAARKYYHDMDNLVPLMGVDNASKGDNDEDIVDWEEDFLENQKEWLEMTDWVKDGVEGKEIDEVQGAVEAMQETLNDYDGDWPID